MLLKIERYALTSTASLRPSASPTTAHPSGFADTLLIVHPCAGNLSRAEEEGKEVGAPKRCTTAFGGSLTRGRDEGGMETGELMK